MLSIKSSVWASSQGRSENRKIVFGARLKFKYNNDS